MLTGSLMFIFFPGDGWEAISDVLGEGWRQQQHLTVTPWQPLTLLSHVAGIPHSPQTH